MSEAAAPLPPGSTIGIFGGGQLGRMLALAAAQLGYRCHIFAPEAGSVAAEVSAEFTRGDYLDAAAVRGFAEACDVLTYEFENVPVAALGELRHLHPPLAALEISQDRGREKAFAADAGARTAPYALIESEGDLVAAGALGAPLILKTTRMGYDGKGQVRVERADDLGGAWQSLCRQPAITEGVVAFDREFSVILVRGRDGEVRFWDACENRHEGGILAQTNLPAHPDILALQDTAREIAARIAEGLGYVGVLTIEYFATPEGPVFNEMAPRVHNSGHWTIEGAVTSQFENHVRAICGLPLGETGLTGSRIEMDNLIGDQAARWAEILGRPGAHLHLYGKAEARPGRKMGHVTRVS